MEPEMAKEVWREWRKILSLSSHSLFVVHSLVTCKLAYIDSMSKQLDLVRSDSDREKNSAAPFVGIGLASRATD